MRICLYTFVAKKFSIFYYRRRLIVSQGYIGCKTQFSTEIDNTKSAQIGRLTIGLSAVIIKAGAVHSGWPERTNLN